MRTGGDHVLPHRDGGVRQTIEHQERSDPDATTRQEVHQDDWPSRNSRGHRIAIKQEENENDMNLEHITPWIKKEETPASLSIKREESERARTAHPDEWIKDTSEERRLRLFKTIDEDLEEAAAYLPQLRSSPEKERRFFEEG
ncbi:hypothetical protein BDZ85DRAFT_279258 [Elsinoe ampelina]|uniref:Uncharacterized protein n=1 Tax=Elsinoe ampelina TaxID=302913 RepID=A0A6A6GJC4_9PEZI|nr:hypothetical protein BDZ85DRAFT_279258 [Elsinoe ampelina]